MSAFEKIDFEKAMKGKKVYRSEAMRRMSIQATSSNKSSCKDDRYDFLDEEFLNTETAVSNADYMVKQVSGVEPDNVGFGALFNEYALDFD